jgi:outer membrane receptor protein involved in Fe transport
MHTARFVAVAGLIAGVHALALPDARAQDATTGAIKGVVRDAETKEPLYGATVVIASGRSAPQTVITEEDGRYRVTSLPPGDGYTVTVYFADLTVELKGIAVQVNGTVTLNIPVSMETLVVYGDWSDIDTDDTKKGKRFRREDWEKMPTPGTDFESSIGQTPGTQNDGLGVAVSGSTSLESRYIVNGLDTTGLAYGNSGTSVLNDFIEEIEVVTGGYNAEYGRSTGGIINVVTRSGSNELAGSVFAYLTPGQLTAARDRAPTQATSIDARTDLDYELDFGAEVGGPIIKDNAWYWFGFAPQLAASTTTRTTKRRTDCRIRLDSGELSTPAGERCTADAIQQYQDGEEDVDPTTGFYIYEDLDERELPSSSQAYSMLGKLNVAATPEHQGQLSLSATPSISRGQRTYGYVAEQRLESRTLTADAAFKWTSKLNDNKTELEAVIGVHQSSVQFGSRGGQRDRQALQVLYFGSLGNWARLDRGGAGPAESMATRQGCADNQGGDPYAFIVNCPDEGVGYAIGGPGSLADDMERRTAARLAAIHRVDALGNHEIKAGVDAEDNRIAHARNFSGDVYYQNLLDRSHIYATRWVQLGADDADPAEFPDRCRDRASGADYACDHLGAGDPGTQVEGQTVNWSAYLRDSWQIRPHFTVNAGLRYEEQRLRYADDLQDTRDPLTGRDLGKNALVLQHLWAPRVGTIYDWTREGRSKVYGHWGRFYESIPMDINDRSFGGEVRYEQHFDAGDQCGDADEGIGGADGNQCQGIPAVDELLYGSGVLIAPGLKPQYLDEILLGAEYEIVEGLKLGVTYQNRRLGRVIEDVSVDGAQTYIIANPGEWSREEDRALEAQIAGTVDPDERARLQAELDQFRRINMFDKPRRDYNALQFDVTRRFNKSFYLQGSYTYQRTTGNYPGLISYDNGQVDPNISSQYDLIELLANRSGPLPQDRPHYLKLDGYYTHDLKKFGLATVGARFRALSGTPVDVLGRHARYGTGETFLLPRGSIRRTDFETGLDLHAGYQRPLRYGMQLEIFADVFNVFDDQGTFSVDEDYTYLSNVNPITGGTYHDLIWAKELDDQGGETTSPIKRNPNFGNVATRYAPMSARFGLRLTF